jgi:hypothetical protein
MYTFRRVAATIWAIHDIPNITLLPAATATALFNIKIFPAVNNWIQCIWQDHTENSLKNLESTTIRFLKRVLCT